MAWYLEGIFLVFRNFLFNLFLYIKFNKCAVLLECNLGVRADWWSMSVGTLGLVSKHVFKALFCNVWSLFTCIEFDFIKKISP